MTSLTYGWLIPCGIVVILANYTKASSLCCGHCTWFPIFFVLMLAFQSRSSFCVKVRWKVSCASKASKEKDEMEKNCCNYFPLKPMIWMVIFRLAPDGIISCNPLLSERRTFAVCARADLNLFLFTRFSHHQIDWNVGKCSARNSSSIFRQPCMRCARRSSET